MSKLRFWAATLIMWLVFVYNIERVSQSVITMHSYTYVFVLVMAAFTLLLPKLSNFSLSILFVIFINLFLLLKIYWQHEGILGQNFPLTVTQLGAILLTGLLARQVNHGLLEIENIITEITFSRVGGLPKSFLLEQGKMYSEVKRARRYNRPLSVIALQVDDKNIDIILPKMVEEAQQAMMKEYAFASIARTLGDNTYDFDTIALYDDCFILVLPEVTQERVSAIAQRLKKVVKEKINVELQVGLAVYPDEAITFESLVELAKQKANQQPLAETDVTTEPPSSIIQEI